MKPTSSRGPVQVASTDEVIQSHPSTDSAWLGLHGARVVVAGVGGIGGQCARAFAEAGAEVLVVDRDEDRLAEVCLPRGRESEALLSVRSDLTVRVPGRGSSRRRCAGWAASTSCCTAWASTTAARFSSSPRRSGSVSSGPTCSPHSASRRPRDAIWWRPALAGSSSCPRSPACWHTRTTAPTRRPRAA